MPLKFPNIADSPAYLFRACGYLTTDDDSALKILRQHKRGEWLRSSIKTEGKSLVVFASFGGFRKEPTPHVHVDIGRREYMGPASIKKTPGVATSLSSIRKTLESLAGNELALNIEAHFVVEQENLPGLVSATRFEMRTKGMSLSTTSVSLAVEGAPVHKISWYSKESDGVVVVIEARVKLTIDDDYLVNAFEILDTTFERFVVGKGGK